MSRLDRRRGFSGTILALIVGLPVVVFIGVPISAMLLASFKVTAAMSPRDLVEATEAALAHDDGDIDARLAAWWGAADDAARVATFAAAFEILDVVPPWDRSARFAVQLERAQAAIADLPPGMHARFEQSLPLVHASQVKRAVIAAGVRDELPAPALERLLSGETWRFGLDNYAAPLIEPRLRHAGFNSLMLATTSATLVTVIAFGLAYGVHRRALPGGDLVRGLVLAPLVSPPVIIALATLLLFGRQGLITKTFLDDGFGLIDARTTNIYGLHGVLFAQVLGLIGPAFIVISSTLARHDPELEDAAESQGASWWQTFTRLSLPMAWPGLARAFLLVFVLSMTDFGNPTVVGQNFSVLATEIYGQIIASRNHALAAALCVWLILPAAGLFAVVELASHRRRFTVRLTVAPARRLAVPKGVRTGLICLAAIIAGAIALIFTTVIASAFVRQWGVDYTPSLVHFLGQRADEAFRGTGFGTSGLGTDVVFASFRVAVIAAALGGLLAVGLTFVQERLRPPGFNALSFVVMMPAVLPGLIFGIGYLVAFNNPFGISSLSLTGTLAILVINIMFGNLFVGVLATRAALQQVDVAAEEAAESLGASLVRRLATVVLPAVWPAFLLGSLYIFIDGMTTFSSVIFLVSGRWELASVEIFNQASGADYGSAAAKTVVILAIVVVVLCYLRQLEKQRRQPAVPGKRPAPSAGEMAPRSGSRA